uniref:Reverse transcriptase domain-containing protein n=1 Tax=Tanacetum cinerariifolium TaxID=118510 RepID=A0A6L2J8M6_TANCI|nr:hypothetical protein [Tanacetum cinerariifolium]
MAVGEIDNLTMEQYLALTRGNQASGVVKPEIRGNVNFEIKSQFMRELREDTFFRNKNDDAHEHVERVLNIVNLFNIPSVSHDVVILRVFLITLTGAAKRWVDRLPSRTIDSWISLKRPLSKGAMNYQFLKSQGLIPSMTPVQALTMIQTMADNSQKWRDGSSSRKIKSSSNSKGIVAIVNKLENLEDPEECGEDKANTILAVIHDKLNNDSFNNTSKDEDDLEGILDYLKRRSYDGFIDLDGEAYNKRMCRLLGMTYEEPTPILIEKAKVTRYTVGPGETYTKVNVLGVEKLPRTRDNVAAMRAKLMKKWPKKEITKQRRSIRSLYKKVDFEVPLTRIHKAVRPQWLCIDASVVTTFDWWLHDEELEVLCWIRDSNVEYRSNGIEHGFLSQKGSGGRGVKENSDVVPFIKAVKDMVMVSSSVMEEPVDATMNTNRLSLMLTRNQEECPKNAGLGVAKNLKKPCQATRGVPVVLKVGFKPAKEYRLVSKKPTANTSGNKKKGVDLTKEVRIVLNFTKISQKPGKFNTRIKTRSKPDQEAVFQE